MRLEVNFEVEGFTILLGQNGEGKTTLLRAVAGLLPARGEPFGGLLPQQRAVGYLPQGYALFPHLRAWENAAFALPRGPQRRMQALELLARVRWWMWPIVIHRRCPVDSNSGSRWRGLSPASLSCCCSMSRARRSMPLRATK
jgi:ABC-type multidrug transport system ATPase subunit